MLDTNTHSVTENHQPSISRKVRLGDWEKIARRVPWSVIGSRDICLVYGVSMNTVCSWHLRQLLPPPVTHRNLPGGNRHFYIGAEVRSVLEGRTVEDICTEWSLRFVPDAMFLLDAAYCVWNDYKSYGVERPLIPDYFKDKAYALKVFNTM